ncbi:hypothetical protein FRX31_029985 [Thalictrum thalictroides]|uniref:Uncharacterized protein n=1 Tax=Thalictrum thalictroides TaxID=46969 RepID=A0A7J6V705_THATH|nr:hypothetical protein FRX31_029985 [Thalictrum thalictroides]
MERDGNLRKERRVVMEEGNNNIFTANVDVDVDGDESSENFCASFEAERVWFEMYQLGHLGFGRVSFSGVPERDN